MWQVGAVGAGTPVTAEARILVAGCKSQMPGSERRCPVPMTGLSCRYPGLKIAKSCRFPGPGTRLNPGIPAQGS